MVTEETQMKDLIELLGTTFNHFMHDDFLSSDQWTQATTQTGYITIKPFELMMSSGVQSGSTARIYSNSNWFNPHYSILQFKLYLSSIDDVFMFFGFKENLDAPTWDMDESHAGIMIKDGVLYSATGTGDDLSPNKQRIAISDVDPTKNILYRIEKNQFYTRPLPEAYPYFDGFRIGKPTRKWRLSSTHGTYPPKNVVHYLVGYIENEVGANKYFMLKKIVYGEWYAD